jgi:hypothetical protein
LENPSLPKLIPSSLIHNGFKKPTIISKCLNFGMTQNIFRGRYSASIHLETKGPKVDDKKLGKSSERKDSEGFGASGRQYQESY